MYQAIFVDIDGTLRDNQRNLSQKTIDTVKKVTDNGTLVILCCGRPRKYTEEVSRQCFASQYIITSNGGNIYDYQKNKNLYVNIMNKEAIIKLYELANQVNARFIMNVGEGRVVSEVRHPDQEIQLEENIKDFVYQNDVVQCTIADYDFDKIKNLIPEIEKVEHVEIKNRHKSLINPNYPKNNSIYCDIANMESNKGNGVEKLCQILNLDLKNVIAIGDDFNDISMFEKVGYSVAVDNAHENVKKRVNEITLSNEDNGVAVFLDKMLSLHQLVSFKNYRPY